MFTFSLQAEIDSSRESEQLTMDDWNCKTKEVEEWLVAAEQESALYTQPPDEFEALHEFSTNFEVG